MNSIFHCYLIPKVKKEDNIESICNCRSRDSSVISRKVIFCLATNPSLFQSLVPLTEQFFCPKVSDPDAFIRDSCKQSLQVIRHFHVQSLAKNFHFVRVYHVISKADAASEQFYFICYWCGTSSYQPYCMLSFCI